MSEMSTFQAVADALLDQAKPFPPKLLFQLSDLGREDRAKLAEIWPRIPVARRRNLLEDLEELAAKDSLMMFEEVGKLGLADEDDQVVVAAIDLLFESNDKHLIPQLLILLSDQHRDETVRAAAANALGPFVYLGELEQLSEELTVKVVDALLACHQFEPSTLVQQRALESLGFSGREEVPPLLRAAAALEDLSWLESALFAMGRSADSQWVEYVLENLDHDHLPVRLQAVHAAGELGVQSARQLLLKYLRSNIADLRYEAIWALSQIGGEGVEEAFERLQARAIDEEELQILEEAMDTLNFTNDSGLYDLFDVEYEKSDQEAAEAEENDDDADPSEDFDEEEWSRYVDDDDYDEEEEDSYEMDELDDEDEDDDF